MCILTQAKSQGEGWATTVAQSNDGAYVVPGGMTIPWCGKSLEITTKKEIPKSSGQDCQEMKEGEGELQNRGGETWCHREGTQKRDWKGRKKVL